MLSTKWAQAAKHEQISNVYQTKVGTSSKAPPVSYLKNWAQTTHTKLISKRWAQEVKHQSYFLNLKTGTTKSTNHQTHHTLSKNLGTRSRAPNVSYVIKQTGHKKHNSKLSGLVYHTVLIEHRSAQATQYAITSPKIMPQLASWLPASCIILGCLNIAALRQDTKIHQARKLRRNLRHSCGPGASYGAA